MEIYCLPLHHSSGRNHENPGIFYFYTSFSLWIEKLFLVVCVYVLVHSVFKLNTNPIHAWISSVSILVHNQMFLLVNLRIVSLSLFYFLNTNVSFGFLACIAPFLHLFFLCTQWGETKPLIYFLGSLLWRWQRSAGEPQRGPGVHVNWCEYNGTSSFMCTQTDEKIGCANIGYSCQQIPFKPF